MSRYAGARSSSSKLANGNIPYHRCHAVYKWGWLGGRSLCSKSSTVFFQWVWSLFWEFTEFCEICELGKIQELQETCGFHDSCSRTGYAISHQAVRKTVLCTACFAYALLLFISFVLLLNRLYLNPWVFVFPILLPIPLQLHGPCSQLPG